MNRYDQINNKKSGGTIIWATFFLAALAGVGWLGFKYRQNDTVIGPETRILALPSSKDATAPLPISEAIEAASDNIVAIEQDTSFILPDLDNSDALLREEITGISPALAEWLNTDQLIRKYVVIANDFSQGLRLEKHLNFLKPDQPFAVDQDNGSPIMSANGYRRYDRLAAGITALDVPVTLAVYKKFRPLLLLVFKEFSYPPEHNLEDIFTKAAAIILAAPVIDGKLALVRHASQYKFADQQLEAFSPIHKQMLRMGPENTRMIQDKLRLLVEGLVNLKE